MHSDRGGQVGPPLSVEVLSQISHREIRMVLLSGPVGYSAGAHWPLTTFEIATVPVPQSPLGWQLITPDRP